MNVKFLFASPEGDISPEPHDLKRPFLITPIQAHPFLTLHDYFRFVQSFILKDQARPLIAVLKDRMKRDIALEDIQEILIRSEKHGAFYHIAGIEMVANDQRTKLTVSTAVSEKGKARLTREYDILVHLNGTVHLPYLPRVYFKDDTEIQAHANQRETLTMLLSQWFEDFHEWHVSVDKKDGVQKICLWDTKTGHRTVSSNEAFEIFKQASKILTLYYDLESFNQIYPWHHAAGDFIVNTRNGRVDVRLITARQYGSIMDIFSENDVDPIIAMVFFFLNLTVRMRLDKLDGVGETVWVDDFSVTAALEGFFDALKMMAEEGRYTLGKVEDLPVLLQSFDELELTGLFQSLLGLYEEDDPDDVSVILANLAGHAQCLHHAIQAYGL